MNAATVKTYANHNSAVKAARKAIGADAEEGLHFSISPVTINDVERFTFAELDGKHASASAAGAAPAGDAPAGDAAPVARAETDRREHPPVDGKVAAVAHDLEVTAHNVAALADTVAAVAHQVEQTAHNAAIQADALAATGTSGTSAMNFAVQQLGSTPAVPPKPAPVPKTEKAEKVVQNGVRRPGPGLCADVWAACDAHMAETKVAPSSKDVKALADKYGWNANNASIEFYQWRKFNGITGRAPKAAPAPAATPAPAADSPEAIAAALAAAGKSEATGAQA